MEALTVSQSECGSSVGNFPFPPNDVIWHHETFSFMMSHPAMSLGDRLCVAKGGAGGGGWVHLKGANSMATSGLSFEQPLDGAG